jgi:hypothetical protein
MNTRSVGVLGVAAVVLSGCSHSERERGRLWDEVPVYAAPTQDRCEKYPAGKKRADCAEARYLGEIYVRKLATSDEVCLDGGFGDVAGAACKARASVSDSGKNRTLLDVREPRPDSKWFKEERHEFWFEEGALVDLYLADHGY